MNAMILTGARRLAAVGVAFVLPIFFSGGESRAATYTWTQFGNGSFDWSSSGNWASSGTAVSGAGNGVVFGGATGTYSAGFATTSNLNYGGGSFVLNQLQLTGSSTAASGVSGALTVAGDTLNFQYNGSTVPRIQNSPNGTQKPTYTVSNNIVISSGSLELNNSSNTNGTFTLSGSISGAGSVWKTGNGTAYLSGTSTFTGDLLIQRSPSGGGIVLSGGALLGTGGTFVGNVLTTSTTILALSYQSSQTQTISGTIYGGGAAGTITSVEVNTPSGTLRLLGNNTYSGTTAVRQGTLVLGNANALGSGTAGTNAGTILAGGVIDVNGQSIPGAESLAQSANGSLVNTNTGTAATWAGTVSASGTLGIGGAGDLTVGGAVTGAGNVSKTGAGTVTLSTASYTGTTGVSAGTLVFGPGSTMNSAGAINVASGATLGVQTSLTHDITGSGIISIGSTGTLSAASIGTNGLSLQGSSTTTASFINTGGPLTGLGAISLGGSTNLTLSTTSALTSAGSVTIAGTGNSLTVSGLTSAGNTYTLLSGASLSNTGGVSLTGAAVGNQTIVVGGSTTIGRTTYNFDQTATALQLAVTGTTYNMFWNGGSSGVWDYTTANWQQDGTGSNILFVASDNATLGTAAAIAVDAGGVSASTVAVSNTSGSVDLTGGLLTATTITKSAAGAATIANNVTVAQGVSVSGGSLTNSGTLSITAGGLNVSDGAFSSTAGVTVSAGGLNVSGGSATLAAASSITGGIAVTGGTAALNAANTVSGAVAVSGGGTLSLGNTAGAGSGSVSLDGGVLTSSLSGPTITNAIALGSGGGTVSGASPLTLSGPITGPGTLTKTGAGELTVSGSLGISATGVAVGVAAGSSLRLTGSPIKFLSTTATGTVDGTLTLDNATLVLRGGTVSSGAGTIALVGSNTITGSTAFSTIATPISGTGSLVMAAQSSTTFVTLSGNNSYSGGTTLNYNVGMGSATAFGTGTMTPNRTDSNARINNVTGGLLALANNVTTGTGFVFSLTGSPIQLTGTITGSGIVRASSSGVIDLTQQTASTMQNTGSIDMGGGGQVWTSNAANFGSNANILFSGTGATLIARGDTGSITQAIKVGSTGNAANTNVNIDTNGYSMTLAGLIQNLNSGTGGGLTKAGSGTLTLTNANTYTGATTVSAGSLLVNGALDALSTVTVASAAALGGSGTIGGSVIYSSGANFAFSPATTLTINGASTTFGGFGVTNLLGLSSSTPDGTYTLMSGLTTFDLTNVSNVGAGSAFSLGSGKTAYLQTASSPNAFQLVVVPEPTSLTAAACGGLTALLVLARRGRSRRVAAEAAREA
jgi:autotransporter-associated beta strand protein